MERASLVADLPKLKAAVAEADPRTAEPVARDYRDRVRSDVLVLTDRDGRTLVSLGADAAGWTDLARPFRVERGRLLETVDAPILLGAEAPEVLGHLTLGFALDDAFAARLRALTGSHVAVAMERTRVRLDAAAPRRRGPPGGRRGHGGARGSTWRARSTRA